MNDAGAGATLIIATTKSRSKYCNQIRVKALIKKIVVHIENRVG